MKKLSAAPGLRRLMREHNWTQKDLADTLQISQPAISLYLQGRMPPADVLYRIAQLGGTTVEWLLTGEGGEPASGMVREGKTPYGKTAPVLELWGQLPLSLQNDLLRLIRHLVAELSPEKGKRNN
ncbi:MAG: hypothetical protein Kow0042_18890 [Calditrichia bacterium]